ncbi:low-complexity tail membrane protein [Leptolyngbya sp. PCC 6406]|uniref:low-complexity tail membrane protein n=1 Tax=Leptolyngbya sp. PCC 6406 TaxID=1173264 RepID=UPI0002AC78B6|nr:low-complexity tail membrane protein [Leptolyngbya sp. PCC 6406]
MVNSRTDPYLWLQFCSLAAVPLCLDACLAGLAVGDPWAPGWLEMGLIAIAGSLPVLVMQWLRPVYLFSALGLSLRPAALTLTQRQMLQAQRGWLSRLAALLAAAASLWVLVWIYHLAPIASDATPLMGRSRLVGWSVAAGAFLLANLFLQVSLSALRLLLLRPSATAALAPYPLESIPQHFTCIGIPVNRILPQSLMAESVTPETAIDTDGSQSIAADVPPPLEDSFSLEMATSEDLQTETGTISESPLASETVVEDAHDDLEDWAGLEDEASAIADLPVPNAPDHSAPDHPVHEVTSLTEVVSLVIEGGTETSPSEAQVE